MHQGEGSRIIDICIMHTCIRKHHIYTNPGKRCIVTCIIHSGSGTRIIHRCIMHTYTLQDQGPGSLLCASYTHVSGSSIVDKCIIHMCIMATCIRINNVCIIHTNIRVKDHTFMHATGSRIMDMCMDIYIIHCKSYTHASGSRILITCMQRIIIIDICIIHTCIIITCVRIKGICIMHTCTRIEDHIYIHASYIYQGQGSMICIFDITSYMHAS